MLYNERLAITVHCNEIYQVAEDGRSIGISDEFKEKIGEDQAKTAQEGLVDFLKKLQKTGYPDLYFTREAPKGWKPYKKTKEELEFHSKMCKKYGLNNTLER